MNRREALAAMAAMPFAGIMPADDRQAIDRMRGAISAAARDGFGIFCETTHSVESFDGWAVHCRNRTTGKMIVIECNAKRPDDLPEDWIFDAIGIKRSILPKRERRGHNRCKNAE